MIVFIFIASLVLSSGKEDKQKENQEDKNVKTERVLKNGMYLSRDTKMLNIVHNGIDIEIQMESLSQGDREKVLNNAFEVFRRQAEAGDIQAQLGLAYASFNGKGVSRNYDEAEKWARPAAMEGDPHALYILGNCYLKKGGAQNIQKGKEYLAESAAKGSAEAQEKLDEMNGVSKTL